ncbi:tRNA lysidine(34) synthetase TilS [TM7 phylum sp. oral taxon 346]|nr:tRNA lysidine(34) synthetase TilS [TM7 phylum sp. oral taxon 346]
MDYNKGNMTYLVAVSGGVDSVCLLDMLSRSEHRLIVAHVEHGIRGEASRADARFVAALAQKYNLPFVSTALNLGPNASEELARQKRYDFLLTQAQKFGAVLVTAHHAEDVAETIAINIERGTGWRGLAVLARTGVKRPLISFTKTQLYDYALQHRLEWVEDATNASGLYQRNRVRKALKSVISQRTVVRLLQLRARQLALRSGPIATFSKASVRSSFDTFLELRRAAMIAASLAIFAKSAPLEPAVLAASLSRSTVSSVGLFLK